VHNGAAPIANEKENKVACVMVKEKLSADGKQVQEIIEAGILGEK
jgi:hypothetical protein